jgi:hypothetical protein
LWRASLKVICLSFLLLSLPLWSLQHITAFSLSRHDSL